MAVLRITGPGRSGEVELAHEQESMTSILDRWRPGEGATHCSVVSSDGSYSASIPIDDLRGGGILSVVPIDAGGPIRLMVTEGSTLCWNVKDVGELRFTAGSEPDSLPAHPTH